MPNATSLVAAIKKAFDVDPELIKSGGGAFEVTVDGDLIYSKLATGRFPEHDEIVSAIKARRTSA